MEMGTHLVSRRSFLRTCAGAISAVVLAACAPTTPTTTPPQQEPTAAPAGQAATLAPAATAQPAGKERIKITYWDPSTDQVYSKPVDRWCLEFGKIQDKFEVETTHGKEEEALVAAVAAGDPPDCFYLWDLQLGSFINKQVVTDITEHLKASALELDKFVPVALETCKWRGKYYGMPMTSAGLGILFWDKQLFEEAGLDPETPPATMDDLIAMGDKLTQKDSSGNITHLGFHFNYGSAQWPAFFKCQWWDPTEEKLTPTSEGFVAAYQWVADWYKHYGIDAVDRFVAGLPTGGYWGSSHPLCKRLISLYAGFEWDWNNAGVMSGCDASKYGLAGMPRPAGQPDNPSCGQGTVPLVIPTGAAHPDGGWALIEYLEGWEQSAHICLDYSSPCHRIDAVNLPEYAAQPVLVLATQELKNVSPPPTTPVTMEYLTELEKALDLVVHGKAEVKAALQAVYDAVQPELDKALGK